MLNRSLDIVFNCCKLPTNHRYYKDAKAVDTLLKTREETRQLQNEADVTILLTLGYLLDDSNNDKIISGQGEDKNDSLIAIVSLSSSPLSPSISKLLMQT